MKTLTLSVLFFSLSLTLYAPPSDAMMNNHEPISTVDELKIADNSRDNLLLAIMHEESRYNTRAHNVKENALGILQIRPIMIDEANRILKIQGKSHEFTLQDRLDSLKSVEVYYLVQNFHNPEYEPQKAARIWNGRGKSGNGSPVYWNKVLTKLNELNESNYY